MFMLFQTLQNSMVFEEHSFLFFPTTLPLLGQRTKSDFIQRCTGTLPFQVQFYPSGEFHCIEQCWLRALKSTSVMCTNLCPERGLSEKKHLKFTAALVPPLSGHGQSPFIGRSSNKMSLHPQAGLPSQACTELTWKHLGRVCRRW